jgi:hypothetical protein
MEPRHGGRILSAKPDEARINLELFGNPFASAMVEREF